jgi:hypothetical protein
MLSFVYYHIVHSLFAQVSTIDMPFLVQNALNSKLLIALGLLTMLQVWRAKKISILFLGVFFGWVFLDSFLLFLHGFDKVILILSFIYVIFSFYYSIFWKLELEDASYHPCFNLSDINIRPTYPVQVELTLPEGEVYSGWISNLDDESCFVLLDEKWDELRGRLNLKIFFEGYEFESFARVVSTYGAGLGLKLNSRPKKQSSSSLGWGDFYDIMSDRGYVQNII